MNVLALDTADQVLSAALSDETGMWYMEIDAGSRHSELLLDCVDGLFKTAGLKAQTLNCAACMQGPGSFTGLRIGFSAAKGICLALGIPLVSVPTLDCLAHAHSVWPGIVLPSMDAKKGCFYAALYRHGKRLTDQMDISPPALAEEIANTRLPGEPVMLTGSGADLLFASLAPFGIQDYSYIDPQAKRGRARELLEIATNDILMGKNNVNSGPLYLRKSDAELNLNQL